MQLCHLQDVLHAVLALRRAAFACFRDGILGPESRKAYNALTSPYTEKILHMPSR